MGRNIPSQVKPRNIVLLDLSLTLKAVVWCVPLSWTDGVTSDMTLPVKVSRCSLGIKHVPESDHVGGCATAY